MIKTLRPATAPDNIETNPVSEVELPCTTTKEGEPVIFHVGKVSEIDLIPILKGIPLGPSDGERTIAAALDYMLEYKDTAEQIARLGVVAPKCAFGAEDAVAGAVSWGGLPFMDREAVVSEILRLSGFTRGGRAQALRTFPDGE